MNLCMGCSNKYYRAKVVIRLHFPTQQMRNVVYTCVTGWKGVRVEFLTMEKVNLCLLLDFQLSFRTQAK